MAGFRTSGYEAKGTCSECGAKVASDLREAHLRDHERLDSIERRVGALERAFGVGALGEPR